MAANFMRSLYVASVISVLQFTGYLDYRLVYAAMCYFFWQALAMRYPIETECIETQVAWYTLKGTTIVGRACQPAIQWTNKHVINPLFKGSIGDSISLVAKNGEVVLCVGVDHKLEITKIITHMTGGLSSELPEYEFVLYEWNAPDNSEHDSYVMRFNSLKDVTDNFQFSDIRFLAPQVVLLDTGDTINIAEPGFNKQNYYMCDNRLFDRPFVAWYLNKYFNTKLGDYRVEFIDHNMKPQTVLPDQAVIIRRTDYEVISASPQETGLRNRVPANTSNNSVHNKYGWGQFY